MEKLLETGKCKAIGVSNFSIKTYVLQSTVAYLGSPRSPTDWKDVVRKDPVIIELAEKYNATPTQVILAWHLARGVVAVPKSADEGRQKENRTVGLPSLFRYR